MPTAKKNDDAPEPTGDGWRPDTGDSISGKLIDLEMSNPNEYGQYPIITLDTPNGEVTVHCFHQTLRNKLESLKPDFGDILTITYVGMSEEEKDSRGKVVRRGYHKYRVRSNVQRGNFWGTDTAPKTADDTGDEIPF